MWDNDRGWGNTKLSAWIKLLLCAAISIGFGFYWIGPLDRISAYQLGIHFGRSFFGFVFAGIIPMIWWAIRRFHYDRSFGPLVVWLLLSVALGYVSDTGRQYNDAIDRGQSPFTRQ